MSFFFAEMVAVLFAPALVFVYKRFFRAFTDAFAMPELRHKVYPFLASIGAGGTAEQAVCVWKNSIQQGDQIVFQKSLYLGILPVLAVAVLQQQPGIFLRNILRQSKPTVKTIVRQLYGGFFVSLDPPQIVVPIAIHQLCIDNGNI